MVKSYIFPVVQCFKCLRYGHTKNQCSGKERCKRCGKDHVDDGNYSSELKCANCGTEHTATSKECESYLKQKYIRRLNATLLSGKLGVN